MTILTRHEITKNGTVKAFVRGRADNGEWTVIIGIGYGLTVTEAKSRAFNNFSRKVRREV